MRKVVWFAIMSALMLCGCSTSGEKGASPTQVDQLIQQNNSKAPNATEGTNR